MGMLGILEEKCIFVADMLGLYSMGTRDFKHNFCSSYYRDAAVRLVIRGNKELFIHCDIRPYTELDEIQEIDKEIIRYIPWFIEMADKNQ